MQWIGIDGHMQRGSESEMTSVESREEHRPRKAGNMRALLVSILLMWS